MKAAAEAAIAKELRLKGVVLADTEVVEAMDAAEPGLSLEKVFNADGSVYRYATAVDMEEMQALLRHAERVAAELAGGDSRRGRIAAPSRSDRGLVRLYLLRLSRRVRHRPGGYAGAKSNP